MAVNAKQEIYILFLIVVNQKVMTEI